jgi:hypothetical protein
MEGKGLSCSVDSSEWGMDVNHDADNAISAQK